MFSKNQPTVIRDGSTRGVVVSYTGRDWAVLDLDRREVSFNASLALVTTDADADADECGLNEIALGCDLEAPGGVWLVPGDCTDGYEILCTTEEV